MKVILTPAPGATVTIKLKGNEEPVTTDQIESITVQPIFTTSSGLGELLRGEGRNRNNAILEKFSLSANGKTGKLTKRDFDEKPKEVTPAIDKPKAKPDNATT